MSFEEQSDSLPQLSVITVVKDDTLGFLQTLNSLKEQSLPEFHWVVIDSSTDRTAIPSFVDSSGLSADYLWVEPKGIYSAMNVGSNISKGRYLYFLNAGDTLFHSGTLSRVDEALRATAPLWAFGNINFWNQKGQRLSEPGWNYSTEHHHRFARGRFPGHQGLFVSKNAYEALGGLDIQFAIAADYHMICQLSQIQAPRELGFVIANFTQGGASTVSWRTAQKEFRKARKMVFPPNLVDRTEEFLFGLKAYASHIVASRRSTFRQ
jgi:glycosyltransferase involved in cell wall biosynthesis